MLSMRPSNSMLEAWGVRTLHLLALVIGEVDVQGVYRSMHNLPGRAPLVVHALPVALRPLHLDGCDAACAPNLLPPTMQRLLKISQSLLYFHLQQTACINHVLQGKRTNRMRRPSSSLRANVSPEQSGAASRSLR